MIRSHFGLQRNPFDPEALTLLAHQQEIFDILRVHAQQGGLCLVLGEPGTGKSVLKQTLLTHDPKRMITPVVNRTLHSPSLKNTRWSREQIRAARLAPLLPLLQQRGLQIIACEAGNFILPAYLGLIVKDSYWRWPERNLAGNAIDFHVQVLGLSFHDAMRQITGS